MFATSPTRYFLCLQTTRVFLQFYVISSLEKEIKGIWKPTYFGETNIHNYIIPTTYSSYSPKRIDFPPLCSVHLQALLECCLCSLQILASKRFGKNDIFSTRTTQKLGRKIHTQIQNSLVQAHTRPSPYQCNPALVPSKEDKMPSVPTPVLQIPGAPLASREYSIRMLPCCCCGYSMEDREVRVKKIRASSSNS